MITIDGRKFTRDQIEEMVWDKSAVLTDLIANEVAESNRPLENDVDNKLNELHVPSGMKFGEVSKAFEAMRETIVGKIERVERDLI